MQQDYNKEKCMNRNRLREAESQLGKQLTEIDKQVDTAISSLKKAKDAVQKAQSTLITLVKDTAALVSSVGGCRTEVVQREHVNIQACVQPFDSAQQNLGAILNELNSKIEIIKKVKTASGLVPRGEMREPTAEETADQITAKVQITESSLDEYFRSLLLTEADNSYDENVLSFDALRESQVFGHKYETDIMEGIGMKQAVIQPATKIREKLRVAANDIMFEDVDDSDRSGEKLQEGAFFNGQLKAFGGSDGMPLNFSTLTTAGHIVPDGRL